MTTLTPIRGQYVARRKAVFHDSRANFQVDAHERIGGIFYFGPTPYKRMSLASMGECISVAYEEIAAVVQSLFQLSPNEVPFLVFRLGDLPYAKCYVLCEEPGVDEIWYDVYLKTEHEPYFPEHQLLMQTQQQQKVAGFINFNYSVVFLLAKTSPLLTMKLDHKHVQFQEIFHRGGWSVYHMLGINFSQVEHVEVLTPDVPGPIYAISTKKYPNSHALES